jgi:FAD/FMN-containing dehydrogenase
LEHARLLQQLSHVLPAEQISTEQRALQSNSQDYAWFSNVLEEDLGGCCADVVVWPVTDQQLSDTLSVAYQTRTPVTVRGGGTGNYGQCVPLRAGLVVNMSRMNRILEIGDGYARVQAGVRFVELDAAALPSGQELRIYPSTYLTATISGFICGGSGGVGSITHGVIVDGNVLGATVYPVTDTPKALRCDQKGMSQFIHAYGTTGVLSDVVVPLTSRQEWTQAVCSFEDIHACHDFCLQLIDNALITKRLVSTVEPAIVKHFMRSRLPFDPDRTAALLIVGSENLETVKSLALRFGGRCDFVLPGDSKTRLTDFTWNHTTLWAKKSNDSLTYLQAGFDIDRFHEQISAIKAELGDKFAMHGEYFRVGGQPFAGSLPIIAYEGRERLDRVVELFESLGVGIANPHRYLLEEGSQVDNLDELVAAKHAYDPAGLLNPGKLRAVLGPGEKAAHTFKPASMSLARQREL